MAGDPHQQYQHLNLAVFVTAPKYRRALGNNKYKTRPVNIELKVYVNEAKQTGRSFILVKSLEKLRHVPSIAGAVCRNLSKDPGECGQSVL